LAGVVVIIEKNVIHIGLIKRRKTSKVTIYIRRVSFMQTQSSVVMCKLVPNTIYLFLKRHRRSLNNFVEQWQTTPKHQLVGTLVVLVVVQWPKLPPVNLKIFNCSLCCSISI